MLDKLTKTRLVAEVRDLIIRVLKESLEMGQERWVSEDTLREHFELMSPWWLRHHRHEIGAVKIPGTSGWSYPLYSIQRRFREGTLLKELTTND